MEQSGPSQLAPETNPVGNTANSAVAMRHCDVNNTADCRLPLDTTSSNLKFTVLKPSKPHADDINDNTENESSLVESHRENNVRKGPRFSLENLYSNLNRESVGESSKLLNRHRSLRVHAKDVYPEKNLSAGVTSCNLTTEGTGESNKLHSLSESLGDKNAGLWLLQKTVLANKKHTKSSQKQHSLSKGSSLTKKEICQNKQMPEQTKELKAARDIEQARSRGTVNLHKEEKNTPQQSEIAKIENDRLDHLISRLEHSITSNPFQQSVSRLKEVNQLNVLVKEQSEADYSPGVATCLQQPRQMEGDQKGAEKPLKTVISDASTNTFQIYKNKLLAKTDRSCDRTNVPSRDKTSADVIHKQTLEVTSQKTTSGRRQIYKPNMDKIKGTSSEKKETLEFQPSISKKPVSGELNISGAASEEAEVPKDVPSRSTTHQSRIDFTKRILRGSELARHLSIQDIGVLNKICAENVEESKETRRKPKKILSGDQKKATHLEGAATCETSCLQAQDKTKQTTQDPGRPKISKPKCKKPETKRQDRREKRIPTRYETRAKTNFQPVPKAVGMNTKKINNDDNFCKLSLGKDECSTNKTTTNTTSARKSKAEQTITTVLCLSPDKINSPKQTNNKTDVLNEENLDIKNTGTDRKSSLPKLILSRRKSDPSMWIRKRVVTHLNNQFMNAEIINVTHEHDSSTPDIVVAASNMGKSRTSASHSCFSETAGIASKNCTGKCEVVNGDSGEIGASGDTSQNRKLDVLLVDHPTQQKEGFHSCSDKQHELTSEPEVELAPIVYKNNTNIVSTALLKYQLKRGILFVTSRRKWHRNNERLHLPVISTKSGVGYTRKHKLIDALYKRQHLKKNLIKRYNEEQDTESDLNSYTESEQKSLEVSCVTAMTQYVMAVTHHTSSRKKPNNQLSTGQLCQDRNCSQDIESDCDGPMYSYSHHKKHLLRKHIGEAEETLNADERYSPLKLVYDYNLLGDKYVRIGRCRDPATPSQTQKLDLIDDMGGVFLERPPTKKAEYALEKRRLRKGCSLAKSATLKRVAKEQQRILDIIHSQDPQKIDRVQPLLSRDPLTSSHCKMKELTEAVGTKDSEQNCTLATHDHGSGMKQHADIDTDKTSTEISTCGRACDEDMNYSCQPYYQTPGQISRCGTATSGEYLIAYILRNGYMHALVRDLCQFFPQCKKKCSIPKTVIKAEKKLLHTMALFEEVELFHFVRSRTGGIVSSGDDIVRLDVFFQNLLVLRKKVREQHRSTQMKNSLHCFDFEQ